MQAVENDAKKEARKAKKELTLRASLSRIVTADAVYTPEAFSAITGLGRDAIRIAEDNGLKASWVGSRKYFLGSEWLRYLGEQLTKEPPNRGQRTATRPSKNFTQSLTATTNS